MTRSVEIPEEAVELAWLTITRLLASRNANPSSVYRSDVRAALEAADEVRRLRNGLECTCGIPQYGPGLEHNRECPRWEAS